MQVDPGTEAVARWLCLAAEYHDANWRLYLPRAAEVVALYERAKGVR